MIRVSETIVLADDEIDESFVRSSGPGGQHVNKTSTGVQLRFNAAASTSLPEDVRARLLAMAGSKVTSEGVVMISATRFRSQKGNREDALARLIELIRAAAKKPKRRTKTRPTKASKARRVDEKRQRSGVKKGRGTVRGDGDS